MRPPLSRVLLVVAAAAVLVGLGILAWQYGNRPATVPEETSSGGDVPPDPRLSYTGPYENIHPSVGYVGTAECASCHVDIAETYARHPMGRSTVPIQELAAAQPYDKAHNNPFKARGLHLQVEHEGNRVWHRQTRKEGDQTLWEVQQEVHFAVGSGTRGYSYLTEMDGYVYQTAISWFSQKQIWDLSPGFKVIPLPGRAIETGCLQCHANRVKEIPGVDRRFEPGVFDGCAIGCERCHGPGARHVAFREAGGVPDDLDRTIVNPRHLSPRLRDNVCEQCHVSGEARVVRRGRGWFDYRPGLPLEEFLAVFVRNPALPGSHKAVSHVEQMRRSRCFEQSPEEKKLGCISCHDPHEKPPPAQVDGYFRQRCLACHQEKGCSLSLAERQRRSPGDACASCHMPKAPASDIAHTALTDHRIIRPGRDEERGGATRDLPAGDLPVVWLHGPRDRRMDLEQRRDLALALVHQLRLNKVPAPARPQVASLASLFLKEALPKGPTDPDGWKAWGEALLVQQRTAEAATAFERALDQEPRNARVLEHLANVEAARGRTEQAVGYLRRLVAVDPYSPEARRGLGTLLAQSGDWIGAGEQARAWIRLTPGSSAARQLLSLALLEQGRREEARSEFARLRELRPPNLAELEEWFARRGG